MIKILYTCVFLFFWVDIIFGDSFPEFPMTLYGTLKLDSTDLNTWAIISFTDSQNVLLSTYTTVRSGWYGFEGSLEGKSPVISMFTWNLILNVEYQNNKYTMNSIQWRSPQCPQWSAIKFTSQVCRYDITLSLSHWVVSDSWWWNIRNIWWWSAWGWSTPLPSWWISESLKNTQNTLDTMSKSLSDKSISGTLTDFLYEYSSAQIRVNKLYIFDTKGSIAKKFWLYRLNRNGKYIKTGMARLMRWKVRFIIRLPWIYVIREEK